MLLRGSISFCAIACFFGRSGLQTTPILEIWVQRSNTCKLPEGKTKVTEQPGESGTAQGTSSPYQFSSFFKLLLVTHSLKLKYESTKSFFIPRINSFAFYFPRPRPRPRPPPLFCVLCRVCFGDLCFSDCD